MSRIALFVMLCFSIIPWRNAVAQADHAQMGMRSFQDVSNAVPTAHDLELNEKVRWILQEDGSLQPSLGDVQIKTVEGVVYLKGRVSSEAEKNAIEKKARSCPGVTGVNSFLEIAP